MHSSFPYDGFNSLKVAVSFTASGEREVSYLNCGSGARAQIPLLMTHQIKHALKSENTSEGGGLKVTAVARLLPAPKGRLFAGIWILCAPDFLFCSV